MGSGPNGTAALARPPDANVIPGESAAATKIPKLAGIDTEGGLRRMGGNSVLYLRILRKFRDSQVDAAERIRSANEAGEFDSAQREAHTLKGLAGNIGAQALYQIAERVEQRFRDGVPGDSIEALIAELQTELGSVMDTLSQLGEHAITPVSDNTLDDINRVPVLLSQLRDLLEDDDADAEQPMEALALLLAGTPQASLLSELATQVEAYDFEAALGTMARLEAELSER